MFAVVMFWVTVAVFGFGALTAMSISAWCWVWMARGPAPSYRGEYQEKALLALFVAAVSSGICAKVIVAGGRSPDATSPWAALVLCLVTVGVGAWALRDAWRALASLRRESAGD